MFNLVAVRRPEVTEGGGPRRGRPARSSTAHLAVLISANGRQQCMNQGIIGAGSHELSATVEAANARKRKLSLDRFTTDRADCPAMIRYAKAWPEGTVATGSPASEIDAGMQPRSHSRSSKALRRSASGPNRVRICGKVNSTKEWEETNAR